jgi:hypothetical protein
MLWVLYDTGNSRKFYGSVLHFNKISCTVVGNTNGKISVLNYFMFQNIRVSYVLATCSCFPSRQIWRQTVHKDCGSSSYQPSLTVTPVGEGWTEYFSVSDSELWLFGHNGDENLSLCVQECLWWMWQDAARGKGDESYNRNRGKLNYMFLFTNDLKF